MEIRFQFVFLIALLGLVVTANAQNDLREFQHVVEPDIERRVITREQIDTENFEVGLYGGLISVEDFGVNPLVGVRFDYHISENIFLEVDYAQANTDKTSAEVVGGFQLLSDDDRKLSYYQLAIGYNILPGEAFIGSQYAFTQGLYLLGGIGNVKFAGDEHFAVSFGLGYRLLLTDWLALHFNARDIVFDGDVLGQQKTNHNLELHTGLSVFF